MLYPIINKSITNGLKYSIQNGKFQYNIQKIPRHYDTTNQPNKDILLNLSLISYRYYRQDISHSFIPPLGLDNGWFYNDGYNWKLYDSNRAIVKYQSKITLEERLEILDSIPCFILMEDSFAANWVKY